MAVPRRYPVARSVIDERQHLFGDAPELFHWIAHGRNPKGDAPATRRLELSEVRDALPGGTVGQPGFQALLAVIGGIIEIEKRLRIGQRGGLVVIHVDVVIENIVEVRHVAAMITAGLQNEIPGALESLRADRMRHPPVRDRADARKCHVRPAGIGLSFRQPLGVRRQPDRTRRLHRLRFERHVGKIRELSGERRVVLGPEMTKDMDVLDHPLASLSRHNVHRGALRLPQGTRPSARAGDQAGAAIRQHIERGPFIGKDEGIAQRERSHAGGAQQHPFGPPGHGGEQRQCIDATVHEQRVSAPNRIHRGTSLDRVRQHEKIARAAKPDQHPAVRKRDPKVHFHDSITAMKSHCTSTPASIGTSMIWRAGREAGSGNIFTHSSLTGLR